MFDNHLCRRKDFEARIGVLQGLQGNKTWSLLTKQSAILAQKPTPQVKKWILGF